MDELHNILDQFFLHLGNTGTVSNSNLMKMVTLTLIDDYGLEMIGCNPSYERVLNDILNLITGSSCLFRVSSWDGERYDIGTGSAKEIVPPSFIVDNNDSCDINVITCDDITNLIH